MKPALKVLLPILVVLLGAACAGLFFLLSPTAERADPPERVATVEVVVATSADRTARVQASGVVEAAEQVVLTPQVEGRVVHVADALVPGGRFAEGEVLARIDPRDLQLAVEVERSRVAQAELELELERSRQEVAVREWEMLGGEAGAEEGALARREPHLVTARQAVEAARSALRKAELDLERTVLRAPFDAMVVEEEVDVGQVVGRTSRVATLVGIGRFHVRAAVPVDKLGVIVVPDDAGRGSRAIVTQRLGNGQHLQREGHVTQLLPQLEPQTRRAQLLVVVEEPLEGEGLPILPGAYVELELEGRLLEDTFAVPRAAVADGDRVWVVGEDDRLQSKPIRIAWSQEDEVIVTSGLEPGDRVVISPLGLPIEGMPVRVEGEANDAQEASL